MVEDTINFLGRRGCTLVHGNKLVIPMLLKLKNLSKPGNVVNQLNEALLLRTKERRNDLSSLLVYMSDSKNYESEARECEFFEYPTRNELDKLPKQLYVRLFQEEKEKETDEEPISDDILEINKIEAIFSEHKNRKFEFLEEKDILKIIKREVAVMELHPMDEKPHCVSKVYHALLTSIPTSAEAECCSSSAGLLITKLRSCLKDDVID